DEEDEVGAACPRLPQLVARDDEVLAQHRDVDRGADGVEVLERAAEATLLGEDADDGSAARLVVGRERGRVGDGRERALGRAAALDLGDDPDAVVAPQRRDTVTCLRPRGRELLEYAERDAGLAKSEVGADAVQDLVEHGHARAPSAATSPRA